MTPDHNPFRGVLTLIGLLIAWYLCLAICTVLAGDPGSVVDFAMSKPVREVGSYSFDLDGEELDVMFLVDIYPGHRRPGCTGGNCDCCEAFYAEVDLGTVKTESGTLIGLSADMVAELDAAVNHDPDRYLNTSWMEG